MLHSMWSWVETELAKCGLDAVNGTDAILEATAGLSAASPPSPSLGGVAPARSLRRLFEAVYGSGDAGAQIAVPCDASLHVARRLWLRIKALPMAEGSSVEGGNTNVGGGGESWVTFSDASSGDCVAICNSLLLGMQQPAFTVTASRILLRLAESRSFARIALYPLATGLAISTPSLTAPKSVGAASTLMPFFLFRIMLLLCDISGLVTLQAWEVFFLLIDRHCSPQSNIGDLLIPTLLFSPSMTDAYIGAIVRCLRSGIYVSRRHMLKHVSWVVTALDARRLAPKLLQSPAVLTAVLHLASEDASVNVRLDAYHALKTFVIFPRPGPVNRAILFANRDLLGAYFSAMQQTVASVASSGNAAADGRRLGGDREVGGGVDAVALALAREGVTAGGDGGSGHYVALVKELKRLLDAVAHLAPITQCEVDAVFHCTGIDLEMEA